MPAETPFELVDRVLAKQAPGGTLQLRQGSAELDYFMARATLEQHQELAHGFRHLADLVVVDPFNEAWLGLVDAYLDQATIETLLPETGTERYYAHEALRAYAWLLRGQLEQGLWLLTEVHRARPAVRCLHAWAPAFLGPDGAVEGLSDTVVLGVFGVLLTSVHEAPMQTVRQRRITSALADLALRLWPARRALPQTPMLVAGLLRKAGRFDEARQFVLDAAGERTWHTCIADGLILRQAGEPAQAVAAFQAARTHDPTDGSALLEAGDTWFEAGNWRAAMVFYDVVLREQPGHPWAQPSRLWCRSRLTSDPGGPDDPYIEPLVALSDAGNDRARHLLGRFRPYAGYWPAPSDATANVLRQMLEKGALGATRVTLSDVEAPSNGTAFRMTLGSAPDLTYTHIATPDPRKPVDPDIPHPVWRLQGDQLVPALPPPPEDIAAAVAAVAAMPFDRDRVWAAASVAMFEHPGHSPTDWLAAVVHPPPAPEGQDVPAWIARVQLAVADALCHLDTGWGGSARRGALFSLLHGPMDWSTEAAIFALERLVQDEPALFLDVHEAFAHLEAARPDSGECCWLEGLYTAWYRLDGLWDDERKALAEKWQEAREG